MTYPVGENAVGLPDKITVWSIFNDGLARSQPSFADIKFSSFLVYCRDTINYGDRNSLSALNAAAVRI